MYRLTLCLTTAACLFFSSVVWAQMDDEPQPEKAPTVSQAFKTLDNQARTWRPKKWTNETRVDFYQKIQTEFANFYLANIDRASSAQDYFALGRAAYSGRMFTEALASYDKALPNLDGSEKQLASYNRINVLRRLRRYQAALDSIDGFSETFPESNKLKGLKRVRASVAADVAKTQMIGQAAPPLGIEKTQGAEGISLAALKGKVVLVDFFATWCGPCRKVIPHLVQLQDKHRKAGLVVVGVTKLYTRGYLNQQYVKEMTPEAEYKLNLDFRTEWKLNYPVAFSKGAGKTYNVRGIPTVFLIDRDGVIRHFQVGAGNTEKLDMKIAELLSKSASNESGDSK